MFVVRKHTDYVAKAYKSYREDIQVVMRLDRFL